MQQKNHDLMPVIFTVFFCGSRQVWCCTISSAAVTIIQQQLIYRGLESVACIAARRKNLIRCRPDESESAIRQRRAGQPDGANAYQATTIKRHGHMTAF